MAITKEKKKEILDGLVEKFSQSKTVVFADYRGLDVAGMSELRKQLRESGSECKVAKKTLIELAAKENKIDGLNQEIIPGPVAATFSYEDELAGIKILFKFAKGNNNLKLLGGVFNGKVVSAEEVDKLAQIPSKEELIAKMMGSMNAPAGNFVGLLGNVLGSFVRVVNAYKDTMPADGAEASTPAPEVKEAPAAAEEAPAAEAPKEEDKGEPTE